MMPRCDNDGLLSIKGLNSKSLKKRPSSENSRSGGMISQSLGDISFTNKSAAPEATRHIFKEILPDSIYSLSER